MEHEVVGTKVTVEVELHEDDSEAIKQGGYDYRNAVISAVSHGHFEVILVVEGDSDGTQC